MTLEKQSRSLMDAAELIHQARRVSVFTGAGMSTDSGIPDFRSPDSGIWRNVDPMEVASIFGFKRNPQAFYDWIQPLAAQTIRAKPNAGHIALAELESRGYISDVITQNIDMLHTAAGSKAVIELHGHMRDATCIKCFTKYPAAELMERFIADGVSPQCIPACGGTLKPDIILFGEQLPVVEFRAAQHAARDCDLMVVIGSSLDVAPAGDIPILATRTGAKLVVINLTDTPADNLASVVLRGRSAEILPEILRQLEKTS